MHHSSDTSIFNTVANVCHQLSMPVTGEPITMPPTLPSQHSRHLMACGFDRGDLRLLEFYNAISPLLGKLNIAINQPVAWRGAPADGGPQPDPSLLQALWNIVERYTPTTLTWTSSPMGPTEAPPSRSTCAMCCADMHGTNGTCDVCSTVLYEVSMNHMPRCRCLMVAHRHLPPYQNHHTIGGQVGPPPLRSPPTQASFLSVPESADDMPVHPPIMRSTSGTAGAVYQRRAQFRMALASYQGRPTRTVPQSIVESVCQHIEASAAHLIEDAQTDPSLRYARITRVHVMCILRSSGSGKYSKWYRESHYFHHVITHQSPPDLSDVENILVLMFGMGKFPLWRAMKNFFFTDPFEWYKKRTMVYSPDPINGHRIWMVATECVMTLFALLYAFPHIPSSLLDDAGGEDAADAQWFSVTSTEALRAAMESILKTSDVLENSLGPGKTLGDLTKEAVSNTDLCSKLFNLHLDDSDVPTTCRQMFDSIAAVYDALNRSDITTREGLWTLYRRYQMIPSTYQLPGLARIQTGNRSSLVQFCSELMVQWMQPYFSRHPRFYMPDSTSGIVCK